MVALFSGGCACVPNGPAGSAAARRSSHRVQPTKAAQAAWNAVVLVVEPGEPGLVM